MAYFGKTVSVEGGSAQRLSDVMSGAGFTSGGMGFHLMLTAPADASLFTGGSTVTGGGASKGFEIEEGQTASFTASGGPSAWIESTQMYLFLAADGDVGISYWSVS